MTGQFDLVNPPDPASGSPLHPLEVAEAKGAYVTAAVLRLLVSPCVFVAMMLILWTVSNNPVTPVVGPFLGLTVTAYVERRFRSDAWAHIPRRRQDLGRDEPMLLASLTRAGEFVLLLVAVVVFVSSVGVNELATTVASVALGTMAGLALAVIATLLWDRSAPRDRRFNPAPPVVTSVFGVLAVAVLGSGMVTLAGRITIEPTGAALGAAVVLGTLFAWLLLRLIPVRVRCVPARLDLP